MKDEIILQAFTLVGRRSVRNSTLTEDRAALTAAQKDLSDTLEAWLWISPIVKKWRVSPTIEVERRFDYDVHVIQIYCRGYFEFEQKDNAWLIELP